MSQHLGAPATPLVEKGDRVRRGQLIGSTEAMISAVVHSPVAGEVVDVTDTLTCGGTRSAAVVIAPDPEQDLTAFDRVEGDDERARVRAAGRMRRPPG